MSWRDNESSAETAVVVGDRNFNRGRRSIARRGATRYAAAHGPGGALRPSARLAARSVRRAASGCPSGAGPIRDRRARRTAPLYAGARGERSGGAVLAAGRRRAPRATDAPIEGGRRAPGRASAAARVRRCARIWSITAVGAASRAADWRTTRSTAWSPAPCPGCGSAPARETPAGRRSRCPRWGPRTCRSGRSRPSRSGHK